MKWRRSIVIFLLMVTSGFALQAQRAVPVSNFNLTGKMNGRLTGQVYLVYKGADGLEIEKSSSLKNGFFSFQGTINDPTRAVFRGDKQSPSKTNDVELFLEPGKMTLTISENDFRHAKLNGSITQNELEMLSQKKTKVFGERDGLYQEMKKISEAIKNGDKSETTLAKQQKLVHKMNTNDAMLKQLDYDFIAGHPKSYLSPLIMDYYFASQQLPLDSADRFYNNFIPEVQNSTYGKSIKLAIDGRKGSAVGRNAPLFVKKDLNGKNLDLRSFKGKIVLLDFWASWCLPCREFTPKIKEIYQRYHTKGLEILSVSWDDNEKAWKEAIVKDGTDLWSHVIAPMSGPNDGCMRSLYSIPGVPAFVLIDQNGVIIGRYDNRDGGEALSEKMKEIF